MRPRLVLPLMAVAAVAGGCGSDDEPKTTSSQPAAPAAETAVGVPDDVLGTYIRRVTSADIERTESFREYADPGQEKPRAASARLVIEGDRIRFSAAEPAGGTPFEVDQDVTATKRTLEIGGYLNPQVGAFCGPEIPQNASYSWSLSGTTLRLKAVRDRCADRDSMLTGEWRRKG